MPPVSTVRINGSALRELRISRGLEVRQLAAQVGRHPQSVRRLETGTGKRAGKVFAQQLANALGAQVSQFSEDDARDAPKAEPDASPAEPGEDDAPSEYRDPLRSPGRALPKGVAA